MNQIIIRTHKCAYEPGEEIFGVVYLNIVNPTAGTGVCVRFEGYEHFIYNSGMKDDPEYLVKKQYIDCPFDLYKSEDNLGIGSYVFPFRFKLLSDLPGSFNASSLGTEKWWKARIQYWISAELIHASSVKETQDVIVYQSLPGTVKQSGPTQNIIETIDIAKLPILYCRKLSVTGRLLDHIHTSGSVAKLRIIITNNTRINVKTIYIKLYGYFAFMTKGPRQLEDDPLVKEEDGNVIIEPIGNPQVIWESRPIEGCGSEILNTGIDNVHIPLHYSDGRPIPPTVNSKYHIKCSYEIEVTVELENLKKATLLIPLHCVRHIENDSWSQWQAPQWVYDTEIMTSSSQFSVPENVLHGPAFSGIPRFQLLS